jgi:ribose transport system permease protein
MGKRKQDTMNHNKTSKKMGGRKVESIKQNPLVKKVGFNRIVLCIVLLLMYGLFCALTGGAFFGLRRILSALNYAYFLGFLSLAVTFVIATGGIDFSIGPVMFCCALIAGFCFTIYGVPMPAAIVISLVVGLVFGIFNGYLVAYWDVPSFITSIASMNIAKGVASVFTKTQSVSWPQSSQEGGWFRNLVTFEDVPVGLIILLVVAVICAIILNQTKMGRYILSLGSNKEAVRLSGVNVKKWEMSAYVLCGLLVGISAIFFVGAYTTVQPGYGDTYNNEAIAGCVMGGTSMAGGLASISGTIIGVFIISLLQEGIMALGLDKNLQLIITGLIVIVAVFADVVARRRKN